MLVLLDRGFDGNAFLADIAGTGAALLGRSRSSRNPPVLAHLPDGSYLSRLDGLKVRIIEADLIVSGADGSQVGSTVMIPLGERCGLGLLAVASHDTERYLPTMSTDFLVRIGEIVSEAIVARSA